MVPPAAPVNLTAAALGSDIILNWSSNAEPDLAGYNIYRNSAQGWLRINAALISGAAYTDIGLINGSYTYRVTAVDNVGNEGIASNEASAIVNIALPQPPVNLRITAVPEGSSLNALWEYTGIASGYNIYRAATAGRAIYKGQCRLYNRNLPILTEALQMAQPITMLLLHWILQEMRAHILTRHQGLHQTQFLQLSQRYPSQP